MAVEIFYLSGTGNSLHVANELQKRLHDSKLIPLAALKEEEVIKTKGDVVGFIFPVHFMTAPSIVSSIIQRMDMSTANYIFMIATRSGTPCNVMYKRFDKMLKEKNKCLDSYITITMANNDPKFKTWKFNTQEELDLFEITLQKKLDFMHDCIIKHKKYHEPDKEVSFKVSPTMEKLGVLVISLIGDGKEVFYSNANCKGCGICEKVCPSYKINMIDGKPHWVEDKECFTCYACLNYCPQYSIQLKSTPFIKYYTEENGRYHHINISADDISLQKNIGSSSVNSI